MGVRLRISASIALARIALFALGCAQAQAHALGFDPAFATQIPAGGTLGACFALAVRADGRVLAAGYRNHGSRSDLLLLGLQADGAPDPAFGKGGRVGFDGGRDDVAYAVALLADGRILVAGNSYNATDADCLVLRIFADGRADPDFGAAGVVRLGSVGAADHALAVSALGDGTVLVAGWSQGAEHADLRLWSLTGAGRPAPGFGHAGSFLFDGGGEDIGNALKVQADGRILVAGRSHNGRDFDALLLRLTPDGRLDSGFARGGVARFDTGADEALFALETLPDGRVVAAGERAGPDGVYPLLLVYDAEGEATSVELGADLRGQFLALARLGGGGLLLAGNLERAGGQEVHALELVERSATWSAVGAVVGTGAGTQRRSALATAIALQPDGRAVVGGWSGHGGDTACFLRRLTSPGMQP